MKTEPIRIESDRVQKVREHVANTKQTISGFIALAIDDKLKKEDVRPFDTAIEAELLEGTKVIEPWMLEDIKY